jgi:flagellin-specific chaperone FliS
MAQMTGYAASAYAVAQTQALSKEQLLLQLYDFAVAGCVAHDGRKTTAAIVELIAALNFEYEEIAAGLYRLYEFALTEVRAKRFDAAQKVLGGLRDAWSEAFSRSGARVAV